MFQVFAAVVAFTTRAPPNVSLRAHCRASAAAGPSAPDDPQAAAAAALENYEDAEAQGFELYRAGEHARAIRMFELAQTLPGAGIDYQRVKGGGMIGSATAPPNPREWGERRFATAEQKLIADYNIACCCAALGDSVRAMELLRAYAGQVGEPLNQVNEMLVDEDLLGVRAELSELRDEIKRGSKPGLFGFTGFKNPLRDISDSVGVEWKD